MLQSGEIISGMYQVIREIGTGGMGVIYIGWHLHLQKQIVIKKIKETCVDRVNVRGEADILKQLRHTYLPQVYDFLEVGRDVYTVMDYIPGENLQYYIDQNYTFPEETIVRWMRQLCEVLEYLHTRNPQILHSDIKPANIMVTPEGDICLIDFNISLDGSVTKEVQGLSKSYASPEQFRCAMDKMYGRQSNETVDVRMDIYSLGAVFYRMMSGFVPDAEKGVPYLLAQLELPYDDGLKRIVDKAMSQDVARRFRTAKQMEEALDHVEKYDPKYRRLTNMQILTATAWGICFLAGIFLIAGGVRQRGKELWQEAYQQFYIAASSGESEEMIREGTAILNDSSLQGYMKRNPEQKAEVLHAVGDGYFYGEQYDAAAKYYEEALSCDSENTLYVRDYMTAMARNGSPVDAAQVQSEYPEAIIGEASTMFVQAQSLYTKGDSEAAIQMCEEALAKSADSELNAQILLLEAEVYIEQGNPGEAAAKAARAVKSDSGVLVLRKAAVTAYEAGNAEPRSTVKRQWYEQSLGYYELLCEKENPAYEDRLSRALILRTLGAYRDSTAALQEMKLDYPEDYKVPMWICYNYLDEAAEDGTYSEVSGDLKFQYHSCENLYQNREDQSEEDSDMEMLKSLMKDLE